MEGHGSLVEPLVSNSHDHHESKNYKISTKELW